jgi:hypothetical protein
VREQEDGRLGHGLHYGRPGVPPLPPFLAQNLRNRELRSGPGVGGRTACIPREGVGQVRGRFCQVGCVCLLFGVAYDEAGGWLHVDATADQSAGEVWAV